MPHASGDSPQVFRFALLMTVATPIVLTLMGFLTVALSSAVIAVPMLYLFYFYDANEWEDQPIRVVGLVTGVSIALGVISQNIQDAVLARNPIRSVNSGSLSLVEVVVSVIVALITVLIAQIGPVTLARQPKFDDLIDGLTFGIAAGSAFAAGESLTTSWKFVGTTGIRTPGNDSFLWVAKVIELGLLRPVIIGASIGLVVAAFAGVGDGPGKISTPYLRSLITSIAIVALWQVGVRLIAELTSGNAEAMTNLAWGATIAAYLILRVRVVLHVALIEAANEAIARGTSLQSANKGIGYCPECAMPLRDGANFCSNCGTSVRAHSRLARADITTNRVAK